MAFKSSAPKKEKVAGDRANFVLGSRPSSLRSPPMMPQQRIKPAAAGTTQYGKAPGSSPGGFGSTGLTSGFPNV